MGFYPVAVYYNKTQHTNNTPHSKKHSTQNYTNNKGHTTHNVDEMHGREGKCIQGFVGKPEEIDHWEDTGIVW
jgi:hypothetical protein